MIDEKGSSHKPEFTISCKVDLLDDLVIAKGSSKQKAEQEVANKILNQLKSKKVPEYSHFYSNLKGHNVFETEFMNLNYFVVDCLRYDPHPTHFNLDDVLKLIKIIKPKKTILTNLNNEIDYLKIKKNYQKE